MERLREHEIVLDDGTVRLRPMRETDWELLLRWNSDPEVLYYSEGDDVTSRTLEEVQGIYRSVSQSAYCFVIEHEGIPVGECWLQEMNLAWLRDAFPSQDLRRIDIMIGDKGEWGRGIGPRAIRLLVRFAFEAHGADAVFGCDIADYNRRSLRAFQRVGFRPWRVVPQPPGRKARSVIFVRLTREEWSEGGAELRHSE